MNTWALGSSTDHWSHPSYEVRVRGTTFLWGSAGIGIDIVFEKPLVLHIRNDRFGEDVTLAKVSSGASTTIGTLSPGECVSVPIQKMSGVYATCVHESTVACLIHSAP
jgi:hypothetical protein